MLWTFVTALVTAGMTAWQWLWQWWHGCDGCDDCVGCDVCDGCDGCDASDSNDCDSTAFTHTLRIQWWGLWLRWRWCCVGRGGGGGGEGRGGEGRRRGGEGRGGEGRGGEGRGGEGCRLEVGVRLEINHFESGSAVYMNIENNLGQIYEFGTVFVAAKMQKNCRNTFEASNMIASVFRSPQFLVWLVLFLLISSCLLDSLLQIHDSLESEMICMVIKSDSNPSSTHDVAPDVSHWDENDALVFERSTNDVKRCQATSSNVRDLESNLWRHKWSHFCVEISWHDIAGQTHWHRFRLTVSIDETIIY